MLSIKYRRKFRFVLPVCVLLLLALAGLSTAGTKRQAITPGQLLDAGFIPAAPVQNSQFMPVGEAGPAHEPFQGTLSLSPEEMQVEPAFESADVLGKNPSIFPGVSIEFFSHQGDLVPVSREVITPAPDKSGNSYWELLVQPGKVWSEPGDRGWSRASFPFALMHSLEQDTHNGLATFVYKDGEVSQVRFQVVTQTAPYYIANHFTAWGQLEAAWDPTPPDDLQSLEQAYAQELQDRFPSARWSELEELVGKDALAGFNGAMDTRYLVASALVYDGVLYYQPCPTKYGDYPYVTRMRFGVWSVTKSVAAGISMLRLAQKYGDYVYNLKITDYVDLEAEHDGWKNVSFGDAVNMATGVGGGTIEANPNNMQVDYDFGGLYDEWYRARSARAKIDLVARVPEYPWGPGEVARYRDRDMFILGAAMDAFLKSVEGKDADIWDMVAEEVFEPIDIHHAPLTRTIEPDGSRGLPITAWGWFPSLDDLAKLSNLLHEKGCFRGKQLLHLERTAGLFSVQNALGQGVRWDYGQRFYKNGYHYLPFPDARDQIMYLPYMSGWIGNRVLLMPGKMTAIRISKAWPAPAEAQAAAENPTPMAEAGSRLKPFLPWPE